METVLITSKEFEGLEALVDWSNDMIGRSSPHNANLQVKKIVQFQVVPQGSNYIAVLLVEVGKKQSMSSMVINMRKDLGLAHED